MLAQAGMLVVATGVLMGSFAFGALPGVDVQNPIDCPWIDATTIPPSVYFAPCPIEPRAVVIT